MSRFNILSKGLRRTRGEMNGAETAYSLVLRADPDVFAFWFEPFSLRLSSPAAGQPARYTPDFLVLMNDGLTYVDDVKPPGNFDDKAAIVRIKCAAEQYQLWKFRLVKAQSKKAGGGFDLIEV